MNNLLKTYKFSNFRVVKGNGCYLYTSDKRKLLDHYQKPTSFLLYQIPKPNVK